MEVSVINQTASSLFNSPIITYCFTFIPKPLINSSHSLKLITLPFLNPQLCSFPTQIPQKLTKWPFNFARLFFPLHHTNPPCVLLFSSDLSCLLCLKVTLFTWPHCLEFFFLQLSSPIHVSSNPLPERPPCVSSM